MTNCTTAMKCPTTFSKDCSLLKKRENGDDVCKKFSGHVIIWRQQVCGRHIGVSICQVFCEVAKLDLSKYTHLKPSLFSFLTILSSVHRLYRPELLALHKLSLLTTQIQLSRYNLIAFSFYFAWHGVATETIPRAFLNLLMSRFKKSLFTDECKNANSEKQNRTQS